MIVLTLIGAALGAVIFGLVVLMVPPRRSALTELGRFDALQRAGDPSLDVAAGSEARSREVRLGAWAVGQFTRHGIRFAGLRADLMLTGRSFDAFMGRKILLAAGTFLAGILLGGFVQYGLGFSVPPGSTVLAAAVLGVAFFFTPDGEVRKEARRRRAQFTEDLSVFLELVALEMAGYAAPEAAVPQAAARGGTWSMMLVRDRDSGLLGGCRHMARCHVRETRTLPSLIRALRAGGDPRRASTLRVTSARWYSDAQPRSPRRCSRWRRGSRRRQSRTEW